MKPWGTLERNQPKKTTGRLRQLCAFIYTFSHAA